MLTCCSILHHDYMLHHVNRPTARLLEHHGGEIYVKKFKWIKKISKYNFRLIFFLGVFILA